MKKLKEMEFFEGLLDNPRNQLVEEALAQGRTAIGCNCYLVPEPLLSLGNAFPVRLRAPGAGSTELATHYLSPFICSYARSILESALDGAYDFLGGLIFASSCTHITRCGQHFEQLDINTGREGFFSYFLDTPRKIYEPGMAFMAKDLRKAAQKLFQSYGIDASDDALVEAIRKHNAFNALLRKLSELRKDEHPKITGTEFHTVMVASKTAPKDMLVEPLQKLIAAAQKREGIKDYRARVMVVGSIFDNPKFTELIEEQGGLVVADRYCFGSLPGLEEISVEGDPYESLARHYLTTCECPRMMEKLNDREGSVKRWAEEFRADGVIFETMKFCDLWGYEAVSGVPKLRHRGVPVVRIEREYAYTGEGQLRTRVQAFIEVIEGKRLSKTLAG
jgi:benzoyl-CoA reductase/2-hydroxyglutaryl-CoA dehydratase subunit BcrC/BadD/HgdB